MLTEAPFRARSRPAPTPLRPAAARPAALLRPGENVWRVAKAPRAAVLSDGATYFAALRQAMQNARYSIHVLGWDIDSRTRLIGAEPPQDGLPETLGEFLTALVERRPELSVKLLLWDYSVLYALERQLLPGLALRWNVPAAVELCLDDNTPFGASHHQKVVVIDGRVAFSGGLDLTIRRWDTNAHDPSDPRRVDPSGRPYPPFHDVQMAVDGEAAVALDELVRARWDRACNECLPLPEPWKEPEHDPWPAALEPHFRDVTVGIARTQPAHGDAPEIREVEALYLDTIATAERSLYIENQFLTCGRLARALIRRMRERPALEALIVAPKTHHTWLEHRTMLAGRIRFMRAIRRAGLSDRVRLVFPHVRGEEAESEVMVHSKVMAVDDRFLRIASSNLCNRSMGTDTECDLIVVAADEAQRAAITRVRNRLIAEHTGTSEETVATRIKASSSLLRAVEGLAAHGKSLRPVDDGRTPARSLLPGIERAADPHRPIRTGEFLSDYLGHPDSTPHGRPWPLLARAALMLLPVALLILLWKATPLSGLMSPEAMRNALMAGGSWGPAVAVGLFLVLGFVAFPVNVLILGTAAAFGTWPGLAYAAVGAMASAAATYAAGRKLGPNLLRRVLGPRINRISQAVNRNGILAVTTIRLIPVAPFTLVNLVAGAMRIRFLDYMLGTALGLLPGIALLSLVGESLSRILADPTPYNVGMLLLVMAAWVGITWGLQRLLRRLRQE
jgi:uncharacterized membrane protein YdjX (TVP38/TMEM64 family)/phosphatidylserine/phosphatidylglycerophosphate/cardiolipin synthase-like enzyme